MSIPLKSHDQIEEFELACAYQKGLPSAQNILYRKYAQTILILCLRYIAAREDAQEVLADVFVDAFKHFPTFVYVGKGSVRAWLSRIAVNRCLMQLRKKNLHFEEMKEEYQSRAENTETAIDGLSAKELMQLIHRLPPGYRTVFNLYVFEELPHKEIAMLLGITENTSKSQLYKARQLLQKQLLYPKSDIL
jgi:RNA polymerase sigma-70 factor (ECF subfamily)